MKSNEMMERTQCSDGWRTKLSNTWVVWTFTPDPKFQSCAKHARFSKEPTSGASTFKINIEIWRGGSQVLLNFVRHQSPVHSIFVNQKPAGSNMDSSIAWLQRPQSSGNALHQHSIWCCQKPAGSIMDPSVASFQRPTRSGTHVLRYIDNEHVLCEHPYYTECECECECECESGCECECEFECECECECECGGKGGKGSRARGRAVTRARARVRA